jgi:hypothetical protein
MATGEVFAAVVSVIDVSWLVARRPVGTGPGLLATCQRSCTWVTARLQSRPTARKPTRMYMVMLYDCASATPCATW